MNFEQKISYIYSKVNICPICGEELYNETFNPIKKCLQCRPRNTNLAYFYIERDSFTDKNILQVYSKSLDMLITINENIFTFGKNDRSVISIECETLNLIDINSPNFINEDKIKIAMLFL